MSQKTIKITVTKKEIEALHMALEYVSNLTEGCTATQKSQAIKDLQFTTKYGEKLFKKLNQFNH